MITRAALLMVLLVSLCCTDTSHGTEDKSAGTGSTTPDPVSPKKIAPPIARPGGPGYRGPLSPYFPLVEVETTTSFAHDYGDMTSIKGLKVAGKEREAAKLLEAIVAEWKGWTATGGSSDEDVLRTTRQYVEALDTVLKVDRIDGEEPPAELASVLPTPAGLTYHPPQYVIHEVAGERVVVATAFHRGHIDSRGQNWVHFVRAFRVTDGSTYPIGKDSPLPQYSSFSH